MIKLTNVTKVFSDGHVDRTILKGINLEVEPGQSLALIGRSGSGKTTLLNTLSGLERVTSGSVNVKDFELGKASDEELAMFRRKHVGFIFQFFNLLPYLTVAENISLPLRMLNLWNAESEVFANELMGKVGILEFKDRLPEKLSGGEKQRVAIVRSLVHRPYLILADEPTGNLDEENVSIVADLLFKMTAEYNITLIMVTHDEVLAKRANRVLRMKNGLLQPC
jgi:putative ABC transport system ATP-binding protein